jgi:protoporphyrin/coproporphyrin ferrochelatase
VSAPYDALLFVSFGGPERPEDVMPFLERVVAGRDVPRERLEEVAEHYHHHGGRSPINDQNRALIAALEERFAADGPELPILFGNRNWDPLLADTLREAAAGGHRRLLAFVTSAYSSYSGCRQYRENLAAAVADAGVDVEIDKIRVYFNHPGFVRAQADRVRDALGLLDVDVRDRARLVFVTHSVPSRMSRHADYLAQHYEACRLVAEELADTGPWDAGWDLVFCSRSGPPSVPWLEPDVNDHLGALHEAGAEAVVIVPIGFISDHMEVIHDLDVEAVATAAGLGLPVVRAGTVGTHPDFVGAIRDLVLERVAGTPPAALGTLGPWHDACPVDCCLVPGQDARPTVADAPVPRRPGSVPSK